MTKRERLTKRNQMVHDRHNMLCKRVTKSGKPALTFDARLDILEDEFPPLSREYIQQILQHEPNEFPKPKSNKNARRNSKKRR